MSISRPLVQEGLSVAYVRAIAAKAGYTIAAPIPDYGIDYVVTPVKKIGKKLRATGPSIHIQIKSTTNIIKAPNGDILYDLDVDTYNFLIKTDTRDIHILVLYLMPQDDKEWLTICPESTSLKHCGYWIYLGGLNESDHGKKIRIEFPHDHIFDEESLKSITQSIESKGSP
jgi:hypothetical protein